MKQSTLGSYIRSLRIQNHMTQSQLAKKLNVTDKAVSKWERDLSYPDVALFPKLADTLGVNVNDLLNECIDGNQPSRLVQILEMSHDIRTPLHIILSCADMAENYYGDRERQLHFLRSIRISGEYLLKTFDRIMQVANQTPEGAPDCGSAFAPELEKQLSGQAPEQAAPSDYDFSGKRILVAEDIAINREIAAEFLRQTGAEVAFAEDGQVCLELVSANPPGYFDLILMDVLMPNMDGLEATRQIRLLPQREKAEIPIIAVSANVSHKDRDAAFAAGMDAFAEKPFFVDRLLKTMSLYLKQTGAV